MSLLEFYIDLNKVCVFSKSNCIFCEKTKNLLKNCNIVPIVYELDQMQEGNILHQELILKTNHKTFPNIYINGKHIGGFDSLEKIFKEGKLSILTSTFTYLCTFCGKISKTKEIEGCKCFSKAFDDWGRPY